MLRIIRLQYHILAIILFTLWDISHVSVSKNLSSHLAYVKNGKGKVVLLLHGWGQSKETWQDIIPYLEKDYLVYAVDLPNFGQSKIDKTVLTHKRYAALITAFLKKQRLKPFAIIGHSLGGKIALLLATKQITRPEKLVLYSTNLSPHRHFPAQVSLLLEKLVVLWAHITGGSPTVVKIRFSILRAGGAGAVVSGKQLKNIQSRVLCLYGNYDPIVSWQTGRDLSRKFQSAQFVRYMYSTHLAHREEKTLFIKTILTFLAS